MAAVVLGVASLVLAEKAAQVGMLARVGSRGSWLRPSMSFAVDAQVKMVRVERLRKEPSGTAVAPCS
jgi:hypothetical protein